MSKKKTSANEKSEWRRDAWKARVPLTERGQEGQTEEKLPEWADRVSLQTFWVCVLGGGAKSTMWKPV